MASKSAQLSFIAEAATSSEKVRIDQLSCDSSRESCSLLCLRAFFDDDGFESNGSGALNDEDDDDGDVNDIDGFAIMGEEDDLNEYLSSDEKLLLGD